MGSLDRCHHFPPEIISHAVWLYHRFTLSLHDVEDLPAERVTTVSYTEPTICSERDIIISKRFIIDYSEAELSLTGIRRSVPAEV